MSLRRKTNSKHQPVESRISKCQRWHARFRRRLQRGTLEAARAGSQRWGRWLPENRISIDQVPCNLRDGDGRTYADVGSKRVWLVGTKQDDGKRFCTLQIAARCSNGTSDLLRRGQPEVHIHIHIHGWGETTVQQESHKVCLSGVASRPILFMLAARQQRRQAKLESLEAPRAFDGLLDAFSSKHAGSPPTLDDCFELVSSADKIIGSRHDACDHATALAFSERVLAEIRRHEHVHGSTSEFRRLLANMLNNVGAGIYASRRNSDQFDLQKELPKVRSLYRGAIEIYSALQDDKNRARQLDKLLDICACSAVYAHEGPPVYDELEPIRHLIHSEHEDRRSYLAKCGMAMLLASGHRVQLCGLSRVELNGREGTLGTGEVNGERFPVTLDDGHRLAVKLGNFCVLKTNAVTTNDASTSQHEPAMDKGPIIIEQAVMDRAVRAGREAGQTLLEEREFACFLVWDARPTEIMTCDVFDVSETNAMTIAMGQPRPMRQRVSFHVLLQPSHSPVVVRPERVGDRLVLLVLHRLRTEFAQDWAVIVHHGLSWSADRILLGADTPSSPDKSDKRFTESDHSNRRYSSHVNWDVSYPSPPHCVALLHLGFHLDSNMMRRASQSIEGSAKLVAVEALECLRLDKRGAASQLCSVNATSLCANCGEEDLNIVKPPFKECAGCHSVAYCSKACQRAHWRVHKADCERESKCRALERLSLGDVDGVD